ncbi:MAG: hypothetical protein JO151_18655 [Verrucomicrobia bacterium]|nr:hypothetical protein [Verrucomicrobiota bacterium]
MLQILGLVVAAVVAIVLTAVSVGWFAPAGTAVISGLTGAAATTVSTVAATAVGGAIIGGWIGATSAFLATFIGTGGNFGAAFTASLGGLLTGVVTGFLGGVFNLGGRKKGSRLYITLSFEWTGFV